MQICWFSITLAFILAYMKAELEMARVPDLELLAEVFG
jgi:hypothetical protein